MNATLITPPALEPITLSELKQHLRIDSGTFASNVDSTQSIAPGSHAIADNYTTHAGASVEVIGYSALVTFEAGANGATGTVDVKIQECDDNATWLDWTGGAFTQVTTANDNTTYEKAYTGTKRYIRAVAKILLAACEFGVSIIRNQCIATEDDYLNTLITAGREYIEDVTCRALLTQTWDYFLETFPRCNAIPLPFGNLQNSAGPPSTAPIVSYKDSDGTTTTMTVDTDYLVETNGEGHGRIVLPYGVTWPAVALWPSKPITIRIVCGWTAAALVPYKIKAALKLICTDLYENREGQLVSTAGYAENKAVSNLLASCRLWEEF